MGPHLPELSINELRCRFFGVSLGDEGAAAVAGGDGLMEGGGESNGSRGGSLFCSFRMVINGWGMDLWGGVEGGLMVRSCFGDEGVE